MNHRKRWRRAHRVFCIVERNTRRGLTVAERTHGAAPPASGPESFSISCPGGSDLVRGRLRRRCRRLDPRCTDRGSDTTSDQVAERCRFSNIFRFEPPDDPVARLASVTRAGRNSPVKLWNPRPRNSCSPGQCWKARSPAPGVPCSRSCSARLPKPRQRYKSGRRHRAIPTVSS
jgi:hypothetical protein